MIQPLNLPITKLELSKKEETLFVKCLLRKSTLVLTPEEWVRQHIIAALNEGGVSLGKMSIEKGTNYNTRLKRTDLVIVDDFGKPFVIVECKAPKIPITIDTFQQWSNYQNTLEAKIGLLSNGLQHYFIDVSTQKMVLLDTPEGFVSHVGKHLVKRQ